MYILCAVFLLAASVISALAYSDITKDRDPTGIRAALVEYNAWMYKWLGWDYMAILILLCLGLSGAFIFLEQVYLAPLVAVFLVYQCRIIWVVSRELRKLKSKPSA